MIDRIDHYQKAASGVRTLVETLKKVGFSEAKNCDKPTLVDLFTLADFAIAALPQGESPKTCTCLWVGAIESGDCPIHNPRTDEDRAAAWLWHQHRTLWHHLYRMENPPEPR